MLCSLPGRACTRYAEGAVTWERIYQHNHNVRAADFHGEEPSKAIVDWLGAQMQWVRYEGAWVVTIGRRVIYSRNPHVNGNLSFLWVVDPC